MLFEGNDLFDISAWCFVDTTNRNCFIIVSLSGINAMFVDFANLHIYVSIRFSCLLYLYKVVIFSKHLCRIVSRIEESLFSVIPFFLIASSLF